MRIPIVPQLSTKDGTSNKNARLTNCLKETKKTGDKAVVRPGLVLDAVASGVGNGLVRFNNDLVSVYGATLGFGVVDEPLELTDIGNLGGTTANASDISGDGLTIVGYSTILAGATHAYKYVSSVMTDLGVLAGGTTSYAFGVSNDGGVIVGYGNTASANNAFKYTTAGGMVSLGTSTGNYSFAYGVSGDGNVIVGTYGTLGVSSVAAYYTGSAWVSIGTFGGTSGQANAASNDGSVIVGQALTVGGVTKAFIWTAAGGMIDLGTLGGTSAVANSVSSDGTVVAGYSTNLAGNNRAFRWTQATGMVDLGVLDGATTSISNRSGMSYDGSVIVGRSSVSGVNHIFVWEDGVGMTDEESGTFDSALGYGISGDGTILVGDGVLSGVNHAVTGTLSGPAPEPLATITGDYYDFAQSPL